MKRVLVTGGCGFIGSHVVDSLLAKEGLSISIIDNLSLGTYRWDKAPVKPRLYADDVLDFDRCGEIFAETNPQVVFHLAAHHYIPFCNKNIFDAYSLNVVGTLNVLEWCRRTGVSTVFFASTGDVYPPSFEPHRETDMVSPIYIYGHTKYLAEQIVLRYAGSKMPGASLVVGRLFNAAGPRETNPHLLPEVAKQIAEGKRVIEVGNLWPLRDFVDVLTMGELIVDLTLAARDIDIVNIGSGTTQKVGDALETLVSVLPFKLEIRSVPQRQRPNDRPYLCPDVRKLQAAVGRSARPFDAGTARAIFRECGVLTDR